MKYRIIKYKYGFMPQKRLFFIWFDMSHIECGTIGQADLFIKIAIATTKTINGKVVMKYD